MKLLKSFKQLKHLNVKPLALIGLAVLLVGLYFAFLYDPIQDIPPEFENIGFEVEPLVFEGRRIHFPYTDENEGESIIIKSDKKVYVGNDRSDVYFTVTNTSDKSEKVAILSYFPKEYGDISYVDVWFPKDSEWRRLPLTRGDIKGNMTKLGKAFEKKKPVPDEFDVKAGIQFEISAGHTAYFKAEITYPFDKKGEFWFEAFGDQGGYGLLDPLFVGETTLSRDAIPNWYSEAWTYRKRITIDKKIVSGTSDLSNFPILFSRTDNDFRHTSFGGNVASSSAGPTGGGGDFVFTSSDGTTKIDHEIEKYSSSSGELLSWVEIPTLSVSADTVLYVYYGGPSTGATNQNKTGTWDSNYIGVWHLPDGTSLTANDSTINANSGTVTSVTAATGKIDGGADLSVTGSKIEKASATGLPVNSTDNYTISGWHKTSSYTSLSQVFGFGNQLPGDAGIGNSRYLLQYQNDYYFWGGSADWDTGIAFDSDSTWHQWAFTFDGTTLRFIRDGVSAATRSGSPTGGVTAGTYITAGSRHSSGAVPATILDEARISSTARSVDWIKTEYNNQSKPSTFLGFGGQQKRTSSTTKIGSTTYSKDTPPGWYSSSWTYRKRITIDKKKVSGTSDLSSFPILVSRTDSDFKHTSFGGNVASSSAGTTGGGGDFVFTSSDGITKLDHEIEKYASSSGELLSWVEVPTLSVSADTILYVYYGGPSTGATNQNKTGTWDSNYVGVWHLKETDIDAGSGDIKDSTSNANNGTTSGMDTTDQIAGKVDGSFDFDGSNDYVTVGTASGIDVSAMTYSAWIYPINTTVGRILTTGSGTTDHTKFDKIGASPRIEFTYVWSSGVCKSSTANGTIALNKWTHVVVTYDRSLACSASTVPKMYIDGVNVGLSDTTNGSVGALTGTNKINIGATMTPGGYFPGIIDEVRISDAVRSADWIKTEYNNQSKPSTFLGFGGQQKRTSSTTKIGQTTTSKDTPPGWYSASGNNWDYRRKITIDKKKVSGTSNLSNFPVLVNITYPDLRTTGFSGKAASGSGEFIFTSSDGTTSLPYEIETYSSSSGQFIGWVNVTTLSVTQDTSIYMYYGGPAAGAATNQNKTGTWDSNYVGVWHLPNGTTLGAKDSTSNANNGTITGTVAGAGQIDGAGSFVASTDVVDVGSAASLDNITQGTITAWIKPTSVATYNKSIFVKRGGTNVFEFIIADTNAGDLDFRYARSTTALVTLTAGSYIIVNKWQFVAVVWDANGANGDQHLYKGVDGSFAEPSYNTQQVGSGTHDDASANAAIGNRAIGGAVLPGIIDEIRISNSVRSADWIKTEYTNQFKPNLFYLIGGLEKRY